MRHLHGHKKLNRPTDQRLALLRTQARDLIRHGEITTSKAKARSLARFMQKLVKWARRGDVASLRQIRKHISDRNIINRLTEEILPKLPEDPGGEVSVFNAGKRRGDGSELAVVAFNMTE
jgi:large subunit ribosomal protein L17